jgi:hypothetical protein
MGTPKYKATVPRIPGVILNKFQHYNYPTQTMKRRTHQQKTPDAKNNFTICNSDRQARSMFEHDLTATSINQET